MHILGVRNKINSKLKGTVTIVLSLIADIKDSSTKAITNVLTQILNCNLVRLLGTCFQMQVPRKGR